MADFMPVAEPWLVTTGISAHFRRRRLKKDPPPAMSSEAIIKRMHKITRCHVAKRFDFCNAVKILKSVSDICDCVGGKSAILSRVQLCA
jgi:hypothetical protein